MKNFVVLVISLFVTTGFAVDAPDKAKDAFEGSKAVKVALESLREQGYTEVSAVDGILVSGSCGFAGCDESYLLVQTASTRGANTQTRSVVASVVLPAVGDAQVKVTSGEAKAVTLPWTSSSDSTQAVLKSALFDALQLDKESKSPEGRIKGDYSKVIVDDGTSKVQCEERKAPGLIQIQEFSCSVSTK